MYGTSVLVFVVMASSNLDAKGRLHLGRPAQRTPASTIPTTNILADQMQKVLGNLALPSIQNTQADVRHSHLERSLSNVDIHSLFASCGLDLAV
jgi:hypothetical protein